MSETDEIEDTTKDDDLFDEDLDFDDDYSDSKAPMESKADLLKQLTDFDPYLKVKISDWLGVVWSEDKQNYVEKKGITPTMNIQGASKCITFLRTYARSNNILTQLNKEQYINLMEDIIFNAHAMVGTHAEAFNIKNNMDILLIADELIHSATLVLLGAGGDQNYKKFLGTAVTRNENIKVGNDHNPQVPSNKQMGLLKRSWRNLVG